MTSKKQEVQHEREYSLLPGKSNKGNDRLKRNLRQHLCLWASFYN